MNYFEENIILDTVLKHIKENSVKKKINIDTIGGAADHIHVLVRLSSISTLARTVKLIKGESSWWIRKNIEGLESFMWQTGYDARAVALNNLETIRNYIMNQCAHHAIKYIY